MKVRNIWKVSLILSVIVIMQVAIISGLNLLNQRFTDYIDLTENVIKVDDIGDDSIKTLLLNNNEDNTYKFYIQSTDRRAMSIIYEDTHASYNIYVNGILRSQNHDQSMRNYRGEFAYIVLDIEKDDYKKADGMFITTCELVKNEYTVKLNNEAVFYIGTKDKIRETILLRTMYHTAMFVVFCIILFISGMAYYKYKANYMLITLLISIIFVIKSVIAGELPILGNLLGISLKNRFFYDSTTGVMSFFLCQVLFYKLFQFRVKKAYLVLYIGFFLVFEASYIYYNNLPLLISMHFIGSMLITVMGTIAYINGKNYSMLLMITYSIFSGSVIYRFLITFGYYERGYISAMLFSPQIGNLVYVLGFLYAVIRTYLNKIKEYEKKQQIYERVTLLRGISHDLKLPLSVIKLNNQMIEKYEITAEEKKEYTKTSLEAILELEKMAENINSYLNIEAIVDEGCRTSIKDRIEKLKRHYENYSKDRQIDFVVEIAEKDSILPVNSLHFDRMLYNLVDNAFKYTQEQGMVRVSYKVDKKIYITVEDNGIGMDNTLAERIFEPYYRIDASRSKDGIGLGLSVVKMIVDSLKGKLQVDSKKDIGTKITIVLPKRI